MYSSNIKVEDINIRRSIGILSESISDNETKVIDRIIKNHKVIEEHSDLDIRNTRFNKSDMLYEICEAISKFNMDEHKKFIVAIGEVSFLFDYNYIKYEASELINDISDYFIIFNENNEDLGNIIKNMSSSLKTLIEEVDCIDNFDLYLLKESDYIADSDDVKGLIDKYKKDDKKSDSKLKNIIVKLYAKSPEEIIDETPSILKLIRLFGVIGSVAINPFLGLVVFMTDQWLRLDVNRTETEKLYKVFKKEQDKISDKAMWADEDSKKGKELKSYSKCLDNCMEKIEEFRDSLYTDDELENRDSFDEACNDKENMIFVNELYGNSIYKQTYLDILNKFKSITSITYITYVDTEYVSKFMNLDNIEDLKLYYCTQNGHLKLDLGLVVCNDDNMDKNLMLVSNICKQYSNQYYIAMYEKIDNKYKIYLLSKFRVEFDTEEEDNNMINTSILYSDIEEMYNILNISEKISKIEESGLLDIYDNIKENMNIIEANSPMTISSIIIEADGLIDIEEYIKLLNESKTNSESPYIKTELSCSIGILNDIHESANLNVFNKLDIQLEAGNLLQNIIQEKVNLSSLKVASINLVNKTKELSNKEKEISKKFDITLSSFRRKMEQTLTTDRREAIIKGSIIPSASKCIKLALLTGAAFLVNPVLAIIGSIGALAVSKGCTKKERQILLDEVEIELKAVTKEISIAESDNNMKKYRRLLLYKNKLEREAQRIRYNIQVTGQSVIEREDEGDD